MYNSTKMNHGTIYKYDKLNNSYHWYKIDMDYFLDFTCIDDRHFDASLYR